MSCRYFFTTNGCHMGDKCRFEHSRSNCRFYNTPNGCRNGDKCHYLHDMNKSKVQLPIMVKFIQLNVPMLQLKAPIARLPKLN